MTRRVLIPLCVAAIVAAVIAGYVYRRYLIDFALLGGALGVIRHKMGFRRRRNRKTLLEIAGAGAVGVLVGRKTKRGPVTHQCGQCGHPISAPSRAEFCSPDCRRYARLERNEIERRAKELAPFGEVPF